MARRIGFTEELPGTEVIKAGGRRITKTGGRFGCAALSGVDEQLYEVSAIDGAGRFKQLLHITLPCILPIICVYPFLQKHFTKGVLMGSVKC